MLLGKTLGKPVMIYAQGVGPVYGTAARNAVRCVGNKLDLITVRDEGSLLELRSIGIRQPPVYVTADPVLSLPPVETEYGRQLLDQCGITGNGPVIGLSVREWKDMAHYKKVIASVADRLVDQGGRLVFLPMQKPDVEAANRIVACMRQPAVVLTEEYRTEQLLSLVGNLDMLIGIRLHALIFAAVMNIPLIGVSYDPKIERFLESIGQTAAGTLNTISVESLMARVKAIWPQPGNEPRQDETVRELKQKAFRSAELAVGLMLRKQASAGKNGL
jgi:polysaccharide pyruvyl transferase CsaB